MAEGGPFVDYYSILQVNPNCSDRALEGAYRDLVKKYHPDHSDSPDVTKLTEVINAYKALRHPDERYEYDLVYAKHTGFVFLSGVEEVWFENSAVSDADMHARILTLLYKKRREKPHDAGIGQYFIQEVINCPDDLVEFHLWYLKEKGFIRTTEEGTLAITIEGVDHVISMSRTTLKEKLLLSQASAPRDQENS